MRITLIITALLTLLITPNLWAVHPLPAINNVCLYALATPHRPDPRGPGTLQTPEERCSAADTFALGNVPTVPVGVIEPAGGTGFYCTLDGESLAAPVEIAVTDPELAGTLSGATACTGDAVCQDLFGENATCAGFDNDASGRSAEGWVTRGPAGSISLAADLAGTLGAHSIYIRSIDEMGNTVGNIFYFNTGAQRTHSLTGPDHGNLPVTDITFCNAPNSPVVQKGPQPPGACTGFFCLPVECGGAHFSMDGYPDLPPFEPSQQDRVTELVTEIEALVESGSLKIPGQRRALQAQLRNALAGIENGKVGRACNMLRQISRSVRRNERNNQLAPEQAEPLRAGLASLREDLGCMQGQAATYSK